MLRWFWHMQKLEMSISVLWVCDVGQAQPIPSNFSTTPFPMSNSKLSVSPYYSMNLWAATISSQSVMSLSDRHKNPIENISLSVQWRVWFWCECNWSLSERLNGLAWMLARCCRRSNSTSNIAFLIEIIHECSFGKLTFEKQSFLHVKRFIRKDLL